MWNARELLSNRKGDEEEKRNVKVKRVNLKAEKKGKTTRENMHARDKPKPHPEERKTRTCAPFDTSYIHTRTHMQNKRQRM